MSGVILILGLFVRSPAWGFAHAALGTVIDDIELSTLDGNKHHLLTNLAANVFIFFKPGQDHSRAVLKQIAVMEKEMAGQPVHWVGIVSSRIPRTNVVSEVEAAGLTMPVLIDDGDGLYGKLGVALEPVVGIANAEHTLIAYQPYTRLNYAEVIRARIRHLLKEITDQELAEVLQPVAVTDGSPAIAAGRDLRLAEKLFQSGNHAKALQSIQAAIAKDSGLAAAHALRGRILAAQGNRADALQSFAHALELDPANEAALKGKQQCETKENQP